MILYIMFAQSIHFLV